MSFADVPSGKRLVVKRLTVLIGVANTGKPNHKEQGAVCSRPLGP
jgi:hypothetical protein